MEVEVQRGGARPSARDGRPAPTRARALLAAAVATLIALFAARPALALDPSRALTDYALKKWNVAEGLPSCSLTSVVQTNDGYIWFGTQNGLVRFDGYKFELFNAGNTAVFGDASGVQKIALDPTGAMWIGTGAALIRYADGKFHAYDAFRATSVLALAFDPDGTVWVGTSTGIAGLRGSKKIELDGGAVAQGTEVVALLLDAQKDLWLGAKSEPLRRICKGRVETFVDDTGALVSDIYALTTSHDGTMWVATGRGLLRRDGDRFLPIPSPLPRFEKDFPQSLLVDRTGTLWVGWAGSGVSRVRDGRMADDPVPSDFARHAVQSMLEDRDGNLWITTFAGGLFMLHDGLFRVLSPPDHTLIVSSVCETSDGALWLASYDGGIFRLQRGAWKHFTESDGLPSGLISGLHEDEKGTLWVGGARGLRVWSNGRFEALHELDGDGTENGVMGVVGTSDSLWIGSATQGVRHRTAQRIHDFGVSEGLPVKQISSIADGNDGTIWFGTSAGVARFAEGRMQPVAIVPLGKEAEPVFPVVFEGFYKDARGGVWISTTIGVARFDGQRFVLFPPASRLPPEVHSIIGDDMGNLWFASNTGICRVEAAAIRKLVEMGEPVSNTRCFDEADGLRKRETNSGTPGIIRLSDGRLLFATTDGAAAVDPREVVADTTVPRTLIQLFDADGQVMPTAGNVVIAPGTRHLHIEFAALAYVAPHRTRYRYRLAGYDPTWIDAGERRSADYTNLNPGPYEFIAMASGNDGTWPSEGASIAFRLPPYFYQTYWFYTLVALSVGGIALGGHRWRVHRLRQAASILERRIEERTVELRTALKQLEEKDVRIDADLQAARAFQRALLPALDGESSVEFAALYEPAEHVGGDIYDVEELRPGFFRIFIADTTGHGIQASLRTMLLKAEYDRLKRDTPSPARLLAAMNQRLAAHYQGKVQCSACCIDVHVRTNGAHIVYSNAAHPELLHLHARGGHDSVYIPGMYLGIVEEVDYEDHEVAIDSGDVLVVYSDGATEETNGMGSTFGADRLAGALEDALSPANELSDVLAAAKNEIHQFFGSGAVSTVPSDDITIILLRVKGTSVPERKVRSA